LRRPIGRAGAAVGNAVLLFSDFQRMLGPCLSGRLQGIGQG